MQQGRIRFLNYSSGTHKSFITDTQHTIKIGVGYGNGYYFHGNKWSILEWLAKNAGRGFQLSNDATRTFGSRRLAVCIGRDLPQPHEAIADGIRGAALGGLSAGTGAIMQVADGIATGIGALTDSSSIASHLTEPGGAKRLPRLGMVQSRDLSNLTSLMRTAKRMTADTVHVAVVPSNSLKGHRGGKIYFTPLGYMRFGNLAWILDKSTTISYFS